MSRRRTVAIALGGVLSVVLVVGAVLFQPWLLFVDDEVDEPDDPSAVVGTAPGGLTDTALPSPAVEERTRVELASGDFIDAEHGTRGSAAIYRRSDGSRFLRIEGLDTSNGPDLHVWLTDQRSGGDCEGCLSSWGIYDDGDYVRLGRLKGNQGDQGYEIPDEAELGSVRSVVIWCDRFNVAFGTAALG